MVQSSLIVPNCPLCGCVEVLVTRRPNPDAWFSSGQAECQHCGSLFSFSGTADPEPPPKAAGVRYVRVRCPECGQRGAPVHTSEKLKRADGTVWAIRRYHKCKCGHNFKSVEDL